MRHAWLPALVLAALAPAALGQSRDPAVDAMLRDISPEVIDRIVRKLAGFHTRHTFSPRDDPDRGIGAAARFIEAEFRRISEATGGRLQVEVRSFLQPKTSRTPRRRRDRQHRGHPARRVARPAPPRQRTLRLPRLPTDDAVSGAPGANDDASGVAAVLELARVLSAHAFEATIHFAAFSGEEQGLLGSTRFAAEAATAGLDIEAMITNDIIGNTEGSNGRRETHRLRVFSEGVPGRRARRDGTEESRPASRPVLAPRAPRTISGSDADSPSRQLARYIRETATTYVPDMTVTLVFRADRFLRGGDHSPFHDLGYAAVRFTEPNENYDRQHQDVREEDGRRFGDVPEAVDVDFVARVARVNGAALASLALAPAPPRDVAILTRALTPHTTLRWSKGRESDLRGYNVLVRETTAPLFERRIPVGDATEVTLEGVSKDDHVFAIEAEDKDGHRSLAVYPAVVR